MVEWTTTEVPQAIDAGEILKDNIIDSKDAQKLADVKDFSLIQEKVADKFQNLSDGTKSKLSTAVDSFLEKNKNETDEFKRLSDSDIAALWKLNDYFSNKPLNDNKLPEFSSLEKYDSEDYQKDKTSLINYLGKGEWTWWEQDFTIDSLHFILPNMMSKKILDYNLNLKNKPIRYDQFMKLFKQQHNEIHEWNRTDPKSVDQTKVSDNTWRVVALSESEKQSILLNVNEFALKLSNSSWTKYEKTDSKVMITWSADAARPDKVSELTTKAQYWLYRESLFDWCSDNIKANLAIIFPDISTFSENDNDGLNKWFALSRAMQQLASLPVDQKNTLLNWNIKIWSVEKKDGFSYIQNYSIWNVDFQIQIADSVNTKTWDFTYWKFEIEPIWITWPDMNEILIKNIWTNFVKVWIDLWKATNSLDGYISTSWASINWSNNNLTNTFNWWKFNPWTWTVASNTIESADGKNMNLTFTLEDIKDSKYQKYFDIADWTDLSSNDWIIKWLTYWKIQMKNISPKDVLSIYQEKNANDTKRVDHAERVKTLISVYNDIQNNSN